MSRSAAFLFRSHGSNDCVGRRGSPQVVARVRSERISLSLCTTLASGFLLLNANMMEWTLCTQNRTSSGSVDVFE